MSQESAWNRTTIGDLARVSGGGTPSTAVAKYWGGTIPWFTPAEISREGSGCVSLSRRTITDEGLAASGAKMLPAGTVLVTSRASIGHCAVASVPVSTNQGFASLVPRRPESTWFLYYWIQQNRAALQSRAAGSTFFEISATKTAQIPLNAPEPEEQLKIGEVLRGVDNLLASLERLIAKKQAIKQGMIQELLTGKTRLPGFVRSWQSVTLGDVASMGSGGTPPSTNPSYYGGHVPWVSISDMTSSGKYLRSTEKTLNERGLANSAAKIYDAGVVLYAMYASLGECSIPVGRVSSSQAILGIVPAANELDREFLYYTLAGRKEQVKRLGQQGTQSNLNAGMVRNFEIGLPPLDEQRAIAKVLSVVDEELDTLRLRLQKACAIKQGMMQELLTGKTRLVPQGATV